MAPNKHSKNGTTHRIREQLNFVDEKKWKRFSSRRLELIDKFQLSQFKASEQDLNIKQIANILRTEFGYPVTYSGEFEKLVTAAIQSVRRNRKRSKKKSFMVNGNASYSTSDEDPVSRMASPIGVALQPPMSPVPISAAAAAAAANAATAAALQPLAPNNMGIGMGGPCPPTMAQQSALPVHVPVHVPVPVSLQQQQQLQLQQPAPVQGTQALSLPQPQQNDPSMRFARATTPLHDTKFGRMISPLSAASPPSRPLSNQVRVLPPPSVTSGTHSNGRAEKYDDLIKSLITDLVNNTVPLHEQAMKDNNGLAMRLSEFGNNNVDANKPQDPTPSGMPFFLREKIILLIQKSKSCAELANTQGSMELYSNLVTLGEMAIRSSVAFLVERFFSNMLSISMEYISKKSMSDENMANLCLKLFSPAVRTNLSNMPMYEVQIKTLWLVSGAIVKDFGFDPCLYPLSEAIHHLIMTQYPLTNQNNSNNTVSESEDIKPIIFPIPTTSSQRTTLLSTLPMKPEHANEDINKKVIINYRDNEHVFTFHQLSNGTPTVTEIMENSKSLFNIVTSTLPLGLFYEGNLVTDDLLNRLFSDFTTPEIRLQIMQTNHAIPKLTEAVQSMGSIVPSIPMPKRPNSVKALDDIIGRMSQSKIRADGVTPPPQSASVPNTFGKSQANELNNSNSNGTFSNKTLPQPVYQPIL